MRTAEAVLRELVFHVQPPAGCAIVLTEWQAEPNWVAACGTMEAQKLKRYNEKLAQLRESDPVIDWSDEKIMVVGRRRVAHWLSEVQSGD
jgi:hypothetical protein